MGTFSAKDEKNSAPPLSKMETITRRPLLPRVVKDIIYSGSSSTPLYVYYTNDELHKLLTRERGPAWMQEPWVSVWLHQPRPRPTRYRKRKKRAYKIRHPDSVILSLILYYRSKGFSSRAIISLLRTKHNITYGYKRLFAYLRRYADVSTTTNSGKVTTLPLSAE